MPAFRFALTLVLALPWQFIFAQQTATTTTQGALVLQQALAALAPSTPITDITLSGAAHRISGSGDEAGTVVVKALVGTGTQIDLSFPSGPSGELHNFSAKAGSWSGSDGISHAIAYHNMLIDPGWVPALTLRSLASGQNEVITYVGPETRDGQSLVHIGASRQFPSEPSDTATLLQHLTQVDVYLDAMTLLPAILTFNTHSDINAKLDIPVTFRFSDYRLINGAQLPFHVQKDINNVLSLDLRFDSASLNSGLSPDTFVVSIGL